MHKPALLLTTAAILAGCAHPQSREEFMQGVRSGANLTYTDSYVARRPLEEVTRSLRAKATECFNFDVNMERRQGVVRHAQEEYKATVHAVDRNRAELTVQQHVKGLVAARQPAGGFYQLAVDLDRVGTTGTKLTFYGSSMSHGKAAWAALKQWSDGQMVACPF